MSKEHDYSTLGNGLLMVAVGVLVVALALYGLINGEYSGFERFLGWLFTGIFSLIILAGLVTASSNMPARRTKPTTYGDTQHSGPIDLKRTINESRTDGQHIIYKILVSGKEFDVDEVFYKYLYQGDEVEVHYWAETNSVVRVNKIARPQ